jgi:hypothetical protein
MVDSYNRLYAGAYAGSDYVKAVRGMIDTLQERYDIRGRKQRHEESIPREPEDGPEDEEAAPVQAALEWNK